jgi:superfamily II DNA or RNA helicase
MPVAARSIPDPTADSEAFQALLLLAERRTGRIPPDRLVRHVLSVTAQAGWPVQRAALEAVLRRLSVAKQDGLVVATAPSSGLGAFTTRRKGSAVRPYATLLEQIEPLRATCDCRDFVRNSLGLCKHVLTVLAEQPETVRKPGKGRTRSRPPRVPRLAWDPIRPLVGLGDWMERVRLVEPSDGAGAPATESVPHEHFRRERDGTYVLEAPRDDDALCRLEIVETLLQAAARRELAVDPPLLALLRREEERLAPVVRGRPDRSGITGALRTLKRRLYPYQRDGVHRFLAAGRLVLADDMGLGKTAQATAAAHVLFRTDKVRRGLLIVPASLKDQWLREWRLFTDVPLSVVDGTPAGRAAVYRSTQRGFLVTNYEQVLRDLDLIQRWRPDLVVLDEAQRIKNWATKTAAYVKTLTPVFRLVLTGTPMENRLDELASLLDWVDDMALEPKWRLTPWHAEWADGKREIVGARHLDTLRARLSGCLLRRGRGEVIAQLPSRTDTVVPVAITEAQAEAHAELDLPIARLAAQARRRPLTQAEFLRLMSLLTTQRIIANGMAQLQFEETWPTLSALGSVDEAALQELASPKLGHIREILTQVVVQQNRKAVVFSQWRRMLTLAHWAVKDVLARAGLRAAFFTGQEKSRRRTQNLVDFHDDPATAVLFATDAGGVGLNLQRAASCCINIDLPWNPAVLEQHIGRIYRPGQKQPINVYNLVTESSIEARIAGLIADKRAFFSGLFDGDTNEVRFERSSSFFSRLERIMEPARAPESVADETSPEAQASAEREVDAVVAAAEEGGGAPAAELGPAAAPPAGAASIGPVPEAARSRLPPASEMRGWLSQLRVERRSDGGLAIEAPPEAADGLAALFEGMGRLLREAGRAGE